MAGAAPYPQGVPPALLTALSDLYGKRVAALRTVVPEPVREWDVVEGANGRWVVACRCGCMGRGRRAEQRRQWIPPLVEQTGRYKLHKVRDHLETPEHLAKVRELCAPVPAGGGRGGAVADAAVGPSTPRSTRQSRGRTASVATGERRGENKVGASLYP